MSISCILVLLPTLPNHLNVFCDNEMFKYVYLVAYTLHVCHKGIFIVHYYNFF